jgi:hypothetical protein
MDKTGYRPTQIEQCVHFDCGFCRTKIGPRKGAADKAAV